MAGCRWKKKFRDRLLRSGADRADRLGHRNKHPLLRTSSFRSPTHSKSRFQAPQRGVNKAVHTDLHSVLTPHLRRGRYSHQPTGDRTYTGRLTRPPPGSGQTKCPIGPYDIAYNRPFRAPKCIHSSPKTYNHATVRGRNSSRIRALPGHPQGPHQSTVNLT